MVLDVSYSRVLGQRPTFYCPLFFLRKTGNSPQAIRRNRLRCFHVWFVSDRWQWVAPRFGRVCTGALLSILLKEPRVFAKFDQFLPVRSHFDTKRPVNFFHIATFPSPTFGPLFAFHCPLFFTKNNNLECRDVLKTVTVTSDQKRFGPYTAHN